MDSYRKIAFYIALDICATAVHGCWHLVYSSGVENVALCERIAVCWLCRYFLEVCVHVLNVFLADDLELPGVFGE